jgi:hypothetical protein
MATRNKSGLAGCKLEVCPRCDGDAARVDLVRPLTREELARRALEGGQ